MYSTVLLQVFSCFQQEIVIDSQNKHPWFTFTLCMLCDLPLSLRNLGIWNEKPIRRLSLLQVLCYCINFYQLRVSFLSPTERSKGLTWYYRKSSGEKSLLVTCCRQEKLWWPNSLLQTNMCITVCFNLFQYYYWVKPFRSQRRKTTENFKT